MLPLRPLAARALSSAAPCAEDLTGRFRRRAGAELASAAEGGLSPERLDSALRGIVEEELRAAYGEERPEEGAAPRAGEAAIRSEADEALAIAKALEEPARCEGRSLSAHSRAHAPATHTRQGACAASRVEDPPRWMASSARMGELDSPGRVFGCGRKGVDSLYLSCPSGDWWWS